MTSEVRVNDVNRPRNITTIVLPEHFDSSSCQEVEWSLLESLAPGARLLVDGAAVTYMSAAGVRILADVWRRADELGVPVVFCRFGGAAADCLMVSGFGQLLDVVGSLEEAKTRLEREKAESPAERLHPRRAAG